MWGLHFFDTDRTVIKNFHPPIGEASNLGIGVYSSISQPPNFDLPDYDIASPTFETILQTVNVPTSIAGSFLGGDASPRMLQVKGTLSF